MAKADSGVELELESRGCSSSAGEIEFGVTVVSVRKWLEDGSSGLVWMNSDISCLYKYSCPSVQSSFGSLPSHRIR